jgi:hypothetical protein
MIHDKFPIDLGKPMSGTPMATNPEPSDKKEKYYPTLYLDWDEDYELPKEGVMEVRFKKRSETNRTSDGKTTQSVELEVCEILDVESDEEEATEESGGDAIDRLRNEGGK